MSNVVSIDQKPRATVIGGGLSGLISAYYLDRQGFQVRVLEKSGRWGGLIQTHRHSWGLVETAANGLIASVRVETLFRTLRCELLNTEKSSRRRYIYRNGKFRRWPLGLRETLALTMRVLEHKLRKKSFLPRSFQTIEDWCQEHLTVEAQRYLLGPALQGIYAGEGKALSAGLILTPILSPKKNTEYKVDVPSPLSSGQASRPHYKGTVAPKHGMQELIDKLVEYLKEKNHELILNQNLDKLKVSDDFKMHELTVLATDFFSARECLKTLGLLPEGWESVKSVPLATVTIEMEKSKARLRGFGGLFPEGENIQSLGALMNPFIFSGRAQEHTETWILGGSRTPDIGSWSDKQVLEQVLRDREKAFGEKVVPRHSQVTVWPHALPQYDLNLEKGLQKLNLPKGLLLCGNYLGGIGLSKIIDRAFENAITAQRDYGVKK